MNVSSHIATRYFVSKRKKNFINFLTYISVIIVAVCCGALIVVLSVFNGLGDLLRSLNSSFDPELKISLVKGKSFEWDNDLRNKIIETPGVALVTDVIEDYAYVKYKESEMVVSMKGVGESFIREKRIDNSIVQGDLKLKDGNVNYAIVGQGVQYYLSIWPGDDMNAMQVHYIKDVKSGSLDPSRMYSRKTILPSAVFSIQKFYDENYIFVPVDFAEELLEYEGRRTSIEVKVNQGFDIDEVKAGLIDVLGSDFQVQNNEEQHADLYKLLRIEKLFVFVSLVLIMGVGSINILFVLSMLAIEKKKDIAILFSMGATKKMIRQIFLKEGIIISMVGAVLGLGLGAIIVLLQQEVGLVSMGMETAVQNNYPVKMEIMDFIQIGLSIIVLTVLVSYRPATIAARYSSLENLQ